MVTKPKKKASSWYIFPLILIITSLSTILLENNKNIFTQIFASLYNPEGSEQSCSHLPNAINTSSISLSFDDLFYLDQDYSTQQVMKVEKLSPKELSDINSIIHQYVVPPKGSTYTSLPLAEIHPIAGQTNKFRLELDLMSKNKGTRGFRFAYYGNMDTMAISNWSSDSTDTYSFVFIRDNGTLTLDKAESAGLLPQSSSLENEALSCAEYLLFSSEELSRFKTSSKLDIEAGFIGSKISNPKDGERELIALVTETVKLTEPQSKPCVFQLLSINPWTKKVSILGVYENKLCGFFNDFLSYLK